MSYRFLATKLALLGICLPTADVNCHDLSESQKEEIDFWRFLVETESMSLTLEPSPFPSPFPSSVSDPTPTPVSPPTKTPNQEPSEPPTGPCDIDLHLTCEAQDGTGIPCTEIEGEDQFTCSCPICVQEVIFTYTANPCDAESEICVDASGPTDSAFLRFSDGNRLLFEGTASKGDTVVVADGGSCLPDTITATISMGRMGLVLQMVTLDTSCDGSGLLLLESYGSLDFIGYSCDENDTHNCFLDVLYNIASCNTGEVDFIIEELEFTLNDATIDLIPLLDDDDIQLRPSECLEVFQDSLLVERCRNSEYCASSKVAAATITAGGLPCEATDELKFQLDIPGTEPTPASTLPPTRQPTPPPTRQPTPPPTPPPTFPPVVDPTPEPTPSPTPNPTSAPVVNPTPEPSLPPTPTPPPSPQPVIPPTNEPSPPPTLPITRLPTPSPTRQPTPPPKPPPTLPPFVDPTPEPTPPPTPSPNPQPNPPPSAAPTGECAIDLMFACEAQEGSGFDGVPCSEIPGEQQLTCSCPDCVQQVLFAYTGNPCQPQSDMCSDTAPGPSDSGFLVCTDPSTGAMLFESEVTTANPLALIGDGLTCLPNTVNCMLADFTPGGGSVQQFTLDTSCDGRGLDLTKSYGSLDFIGYTCDENDIHHCFIDVLHSITPCNTGQVNLFLAELTFTLNDETTDLIPLIVEDDRTLVPDECLVVSKPSIIERCRDYDYCASSSVVAETDGPGGSPGGPPCEDEEEVKFTLEISIPIPNPTPPAPSPVPTGASPAPSLAPTGSCNLEVDLDCTVPELGGVDCDNIPTFTPICEDSPFEMTFRYNGGDCRQSFNIQPRSLFTCDDFGSIPGNPTESGTLTFIQAFDLGGGEIYFEGLVPVGELFNLTGLISANMNISFWDPGDTSGPPFRDMTETEITAIVQPQNLLQTVKYHSSCSRNLFLKDRFGSAQLVQFKSEKQGLVTCFVHTVLDFAIEIPILTDGSSQVRLLTLFSITNQFGVVNRTSEVNGMIASSGEVVEVSPIEATIDLTAKARYAFETVITGETVESGIGCFGQDFFEFTAGNPLPPIFPTLAPTRSPTSSPFPTGDPETAGCDLLSIVECDVTGGPGGQTCENLSEPLVTQCRGSSVALTNLKLRYTGGECGDFDNCEDHREGGPDNLDRVIIDVSDSDGDYFEGSVNLGGFFDITNPVGFTEGSIIIDIYEFDSDIDDNKGIRLQSVELSTQCQDPGVGLDAELILGNEYGGVTLAAFENDQDGVQSNFAEVTATFTVSNPSGFEATLNSAVVSSSLSGFDQQVLTQPMLLGRGDEEVLFVETEIVNLPANATEFFILVLTVQGNANTPAAIGCDSTDIFTFTVEEATTPTATAAATTATATTRNGFQKKSPLMNRGEVTTRIINRNQGN